MCYPEYSHGLIMYQDVIEFHEKDGVNIFIATFMGISYLTHGVWNNSEEVVS